MILLAKADALEAFLQASQVEAVIPKAAAREACEVKQSVDALIIQRLIAEEKIAVIAPRDRRTCERLRRDLALGAGEAEVLALALEKRADLVATDDKRPIDACKLVKLAFTPAPAIVVRMYERGAPERKSAMLKLDVLEREGRYKKSILAAMRSRLEVS